MDVKLKLFNMLCELAADEVDNTDSEVDTEVGAEVEVDTDDDTDTTAENDGAIDTIDIDGESYTLAQLREFKQGNLRQND